jgi:hypothetical protein
VSERLKSFTAGCLSAYVGTVVDTGVTDPYLFDFYLQVSSRLLG